MRLKDQSILKAAKINGLDRAGMKKLATYGMINQGKIAKNESTPNLVEVMACESGCIGGPSVITNPGVAEGLLAAYAKGGT